MRQTERVAMRSLAMGSLVLAMLLAGCSLIAPVGTNKSGFTYTQPDDNGKVVVGPVLPEDAASGPFTFGLGIDEDTRTKLKVPTAELQGGATGCLDSSPEDATCFELDVSALPAGFYPINIYAGEAEEAVASELIVVVTEPAAEDGAASETEE